MSSGRTFEILVRNAQDEYVTTVAVEEQNRFSPAFLNSLPSQWVVTEYTRAPHILGKNLGTEGVVSMAAVKDAGKLMTFRGYLAERRKAGVVRLSNCGSLFLLPSSAALATEGQTILCVLPTVVDREMGEPNGRDHAGSLRQASVAAPSTTLLLGHDSPDVSARSEVVQGGQESSSGGFSLGSLMGTLDKTHSSIAATAAVDRVSKAQSEVIKMKVEKFKNEVRAKLEAFSTDPAAILHSFPFVEKSLRAIQVGLAEDFDGITARTEGEMDDRHVVVYKSGYEPPEEDVQLDPQTHIGGGRREKSAASAGLAPMPAIMPGKREAGKGGDPAKSGPDASDLVPIGTIVKDRRTVQDIEEETKRAAKRRRGEHGEIGLGGR